MAQPGSWSGAQPISYAYVWQRCDPAGGGCTDIQRGNAKTYVPGSADVDFTLRVQVTATNSRGSGSTTSPRSSVVQGQPVAPKNSSPPTVSGTPQEGQTLKADPGTWSGTRPIGYSYQWRRCSALGVCEDLAGATAKNYSLTSADVGSRLQVRVTASNSVGWSAATSAQSAVVQGLPVAPKNSSPPTISGTAQAGQTLTAEPGTWSGTQPISYSYRWRRCASGGSGCSDITAATAKTYTPTSQDVGSTLRVAVTASNTAGASVATSAATATVSGAPASDTTAPAAPTGLTATGGAGSVSLDWVNSSEPDLAGYRVYRRNADGSWPTTPLTTTTVSNYTNSGLTNGTSYTYRVTAVDGSGNESAPSASVSATPVTAGAGDPVVTAAGDIAGSATDGVATAEMIKGINPSAVLTLGDNAYEDGSLQQYNDYYDPSWGAFKQKTYPTPGNHDYHTPAGVDYFTYFGSRAQAEYYSYDLGSWHLIALNGELSHSAGSAQEVWLKSDLAANAGKCTLAYWHEPRFTSGDVHGDNSSFGPFWQDLYAAHADVVLNGHNHNYERFGLQNPQAQADPNGMREFVVGTGGVSHYGFGTPKPNSEVRNGDTYGVLKLTLHSGSYDFQFAPVAGKTFTDSGSNSCHNGAPGADTSPPAAPSGLTASPGDGHIALDWSDNSESDLAGYRVYRDGSRIASPTSSSYDDTGLINGTSHSYQVSAIDKAGNESPKTAALAATPQASSSGSRYPLRGVYSRETDGTFDRQTAIGFNLIDSDPGTISDVDGVNQKAMVWVGSYDSSTCQFDVSDSQLRTWVSAHVGDKRVGFWYLSNEPIQGADNNCPNVYQQHKDRTALVHSIDPNAKTFVGTDGNSDQYTLDQLPHWKDTTDIVGINAYICHQGDSTCDYAWIDTIGQAAANAGLNFWGQVQAFGDPDGQGYEMCGTECGKARLPTPAELHEEFNHWRATKMSNYLVFAWDWPSGQSSLWLANHGELQSQLAIENGTS